MKVVSNNLFIIILIIFVVFILFLRSPVYKYILGESRSNLLEGMTSSKTHESEFILAKDRGMWSGEGPNEYTCRDNPKRNTTGNNGDYDRYCIFDKEIDAQNHCKSEDRCVGYISNQARNMFTATAKPVPNPGANGRHYEKRKIPASEPRLSFQKLDNTNCVDSRIGYPGESSIVGGYKYLGDFDSYDQCAQSNNIPREAKAITYHDTSISGYARQCYSINDNNTKVLNKKYATCGIVIPAAAPLCWNTTNAKEKEKCMGGWLYNNGTCTAPKGINASCSPYNWNSMSNYNENNLTEWLNQCGHSDPPGCNRGEHVDTPAASALLAAPAPAIATSLGPTIPDPTQDAMSGFSKKKCNNPSMRDGNCIPVCVAVSGGKVVGPPIKIYGGKDSADGPDGLPFNMGNANYFYEMNEKTTPTSSGGEYYPITDPLVSRVKYGSDTDCTQNYACSASGIPGSDGGSANCNLPPQPPRPAPRPGGGPCDPSCTRVKNPFFAKSACKFDKNTGYTCSACPQMDNGEINCNNFRATCSGCGSDLMATFPAGWQPDRDRRPGPKEKPFTRTECETSCEKPGVKIFQNYLDTFRDGSGFDDGSCQIIGKNKDMVKCRPIRKTAGLGAGGNGGMKPIPAPDECVLCDEPKLQGYATFERKWDKYAKQNDYVNVKLVDGPRSGASYGPNEEGSGRRVGGGGGGGGGGAQNWERWDGGDSTNGAGWRGQQTGGWYQTMTDVKNKSFQVATSNNDANRQQAYIESLKLELNKLNDEYITQQTLVNKMKEDISKMVSACGLAKSKLGEAMKSSVSDNMNKNAAITLKEKIDANTNAGNIEMLQQNVKTSCDKSTEVSNSYTSAKNQLSVIDAKRQELSKKLAIAINSVTENKTTININLMGGMGGMGDCGGRLGCGTGVNNNNMYPGNFFKPQRINDMINNVNIPMPYQDIIIF